MAGIPPLRPSGVGAYTGVKQPAEPEEDYVPPVPDEEPPPPTPRGFRRRRVIFYVIAAVVAIAFVIWVMA